MAEKCAKLSGSVDGMRVRRVEATARQVTKSGSCGQQKQKFVFVENMGDLSHDQRILGSARNTKGR